MFPKDKTITPAVLKARLVVIGNAIAATAQELRNIELMDDPKLNEIGFLNGFVYQLDALKDDLAKHKTKIAEEAERQRITDANIAKEAARSIEHLDLLIEGRFKSHSGERLNEKIDCDVLSEATLETVAMMAFRRLGGVPAAFVSVPSGGDRLARAFEQMARLNASKIPAARLPGLNIVLVVDDVYTTGKSLREAINKEIRAKEWIGGHNATRVQGFAIFNRSGRFIGDRDILTLFTLDGDEIARRHEDARASRLAGIGKLINGSDPDLPDVHF